MDLYIPAFYVAVAPKFLSVEAVMMLQVCSPVYPFHALQCILLLWLSSQTYHTHQQFEWTLSVLPSALSPFCYQGPRWGSTILAPTTTTEGEFIEKKLWVGTHSPTNKQQEESAQRISSSQESRKKERKGKNTLKTNLTQAQVLQSQGVGIDDDRVQSTREAM